MNEAVVNAFIGSCVGLLVLLVGFFANQWFTTMQKSLEQLNNTLTVLSKAVASLDKRIDDHDRDLDDHDAALKHLHRVRCPNAECPHASHTDPGSPALFYQERREVQRD